MSETLNCQACSDSMDALCPAVGFNLTCQVVAAGRGRPADILLPHWYGGRPCAVDVSVHPLAFLCQTVKTDREAIGRCCNESNDRYSLCAVGIRLCLELKLTVFSMASHIPKAAAVVDDDSVQHRQRLQQMLASLNQEIARQILQGPLNSASPIRQPFGRDADLQEAQDDIDQPAATSDETAPAAT